MTLTKTKTLVSSCSLDTKEKRNCQYIIICIIKWNPTLKYRTTNINISDDCKESLQSFFPPVIFYLNQRRDLASQGNLRSIFYHQHKLCMQVWMGKLTSMHSTISQTIGQNSLPNCAKSVVWNTLSTICNTAIMYHENTSPHTKSVLTSHSQV